jgi:hypothetical protein
MAVQTIAISAPYPRTKVTMILPAPNFGNIRASQSSIQMKRSMTGEVWTYARPNDRDVVQLSFSLSRQKDLELGEFIRVYHTAFWKIVDHNGNSWKCQLVGEPIKRVAHSRNNATSSSTGGEVINVTLKFSVEAI